MTLIKSQEKYRLDLFSHDESGWRHKGNISALSLNNFQYSKPIIGELVFTTSMTGYEQSFSDPSYERQILLFTCTHIGNYGINLRNLESLKMIPEVIIVNDFSPGDYLNNNSFYENCFSLANFLTQQNKLGLFNVDTRLLTRMIAKSDLRLRENETSVMVVITPESLINETEETIKKSSKNDLIEFLLSDKHPIENVSTKSSTIHHPFIHSLNNISQVLRIVLIDFGMKKSILTQLLAKGFEVVVVPFDTSQDEILKLNPDGICLSNGPGNPEELLNKFPDIKKTITFLASDFPILAICMGHQLLGLSLGGETWRLTFGNRGANHPVFNLKKNNVIMTSQNHGYALKNSLPSPVEVTEINLNDQSVEGFIVNNKPIISVQYHPEANPGPTDSSFYFEDFKNLVLNHHLSKSHRQGFHQ